MRAWFVLAIASVGCRYSLDERELPPLCKVSTTAMVCAEAEKHSDYQWLQDNLFATNCSGDDCHSPVAGSKPTGEMVLTENAYDALVGQPAKYDPNHLLVDPGNPNGSYLLYMMKGVRQDADEGGPKFHAPPASVGFMPQANNTLCCQKLEAVARWIEAGAER